MKFTAHFYLLNYDFSPEFAEANHNGEESENNRYYDWQDELSLKNGIKSIEVKRETSYFLKGERDNGTLFSEEVPQMMIFEILGEDGSITKMGCSEVLVEMYEIAEEEDEIILTVTMAENEPLSNPIPGIYIAASFFPKALIN